MRRSEVRILSGVDKNTPSRRTWLGVIRVINSVLFLEELEEGLITLRIENVHPFEIDLQPDFVPDIDHYVRIEVGYN